MSANAGEGRQSAHAAVVDDVEDVADILDV